MHPFLFSLVFIAISGLTMIAGMFLPTYSAHSMVDIEAEVLRRARDVAINNRGATDVNAVVAAMTSNLSTLNTVISQLQVVGTAGAGVNVNGINPYFARYDISFNHTNVVQSPFVDEDDKLATSKSVSIIAENPALL